MQIRQLTNQEFNNFSENFSSKSFYQSSEYGFVMNNHGYDSLLIGLEENGIIIAASLLLLKKEGRFKYAYAPKGFLIDFDDFELVFKFTKLLKEFLAKDNIVAVKINPLIIRKIFDFKKQISYDKPNYEDINKFLQQNGYYHLGYNNFFESLKPRFEGFVDISLSEHQLFKNLNKQYRTKIRTAIRSGIKIFKGEAKDLDLLYQFTKDKYIRELNYYQDSFGYFSNRNKIDFYFTKLDTSVYLRSVQKKLHDQEQLSTKLNNLMISSNGLKKDRVIKKKLNVEKYLQQYNNDLVMATNLLKNNPDGIVTAAILIIKHGVEVNVLIHGYDEDLKKLNSTHLLIWQLMCFYKKLGFTKFNLGGMSNVISDKDKYVGLDNFKLGFDAKVIEYIGDLELVVSKRNYSLYRNYLPIKNFLKNKN